MIHCSKSEYNWIYQKKVCEREFAVKLFLISLSKPFLCSSEMYSTFLLHYVLDRDFPISKPALCHKRTITPQSIWLPHMCSMQFFMFYLMTKILIKCVILCTKEHCHQSKGWDTSINNSSVYGTVKTFYKKSDPKTFLLKDWFYNNNMGKLEIFFCNIKVVQITALYKFSFHFWV